MSAATVRRVLALAVAALVALNIGAAVALVDRAQHADEAPAELVATTCPDVCRPAAELLPGSSCFLEWADYAPWWGWAPVCKDRAAVDRLPDEVRRILADIAQLPDADRETVITGAMLADLPPADRRAIRAKIQRAHALSR